MYKTILVLAVMLLITIYLAQRLPRRAAINKQMRENGDWAPMNNPLFSQYQWERARKFRLN
jgi:hypothetical protein